jgi:predicted phage-related endonuclease
MALHRYRIQKPTHGGQDWLNVRFKDENGNKRVSASAVAAIYGLHPFVKRDAYAAELLGDVAPTPIPPNPAMERGNRLEPFVLQWAADKLGVPYTEPKEMFVCDSNNGARMVATLDGFYEEGDTRKVLEIKTTTRQWEGKLPDYWRIQGIQQAICADVEEITWAVFDPSMILHIHIQQVTPAEQAEHISAVEAWLNNIELGMVPPGVKWSYETIQTRHQKAVNRIQELPNEAMDLFDRLRHVRSELASYKELEDQLKAQICDLIGDADTAVIGDTTVATWKPQTRSSFDAKAFKEAYPELAQKFTKQVNTRMFLLKGEH